MRRKKKVSWGQILRRGVAFALAVVGLWTLGLTSQGSGAVGVLQGLANRPELLLQLIASQMHTSPPDSLQLAGVGRTVILRSPLLKSGIEAVALAQEGEPISLEEHEEEIKTAPLQPPEDTQVVVHTSVGKDDGSFLSTENIYIKNSAGLNVDVAAMAESKVDLEIDQDGGPQILIIHTHGSEAYLMADEDLYVESDPYRTTDCAQNVVRVGDEMAQVFRQEGFGVIHDTNLYDYPSYNGAYTRSREAVQRWLEEYPSICLVLDVHRDALVSSEGIPYKLVADCGGEQVAQVMLVVGSDDSGADHPNWRQNLALAVQLQLRLTADSGQLARPITLRSSRFNQDLLSGSLLVEVGGHGNTLQEAIAGGRLFAQSTAKLLKGEG